jgi:hypothetical protein
MWPSGAASPPIHVKHLLTPPTLLVSLEGLLIGLQVCSRLMLRENQTY